MTPLPHSAPVEQHVLAVLNQYEDLGVSLNDPDFVFEVMSVKERLGLPTTREGRS